MGNGSKLHNKLSHSHVKIKVEYSNKYPFRVGLISSSEETILTNSRGENKNQK